MATEMYPPNGRAWGCSGIRSSDMRCLLIRQRPVRCQKQVFLLSETLLNSVRSARSESNAACCAQTRSCPCGTNSQECYDPLFEENFCYPLVDFWLLGHSPLRPFDALLCLEYFIAFVGTGKVGKTTPWDAHALEFSTSDAVRRSTC